MSDKIDINMASAAELDARPALAGHWFSRLSPSLSRLIGPASPVQTRGLTVKLPKRLPYEALLAAALALGSCNGPLAQASERLEIADVNARSAIARVDALESRVSEIEQRLGL